jgi:hypothetical protein
MENCQTKRCIHEQGNDRGLLILAAFVIVLIMTAGR